MTNPVAGRMNIDGAATLDALVADPSLVDGLAPKILADLRRQAAHLLVDLNAALARQAARDTAHPAPHVSMEPERAVKMGEACALLGMSKDYAYRHWKDLGGYRDVDGHVKFSSRVIARHIQRQTRR